MLNGLQPNYELHNETPSYNCSPINKDVKEIARLSSELGRTFTTIIERTNYKKKSKVSFYVINYEGIKHHMSTYRFKNISDYTNKYMNWLNLNCCGGWVFNEEYLYDAVQLEFKPLSQIVMRTEEAEEKFLSNLLPLPNHINYYIQRRETGFPPLLYIYLDTSLDKLYNLDELIAAYREQDVTRLDAKYLKYLFSLPLSCFAESKNGYDFMSPTSVEDLILTGALLGYPLESTCSLILGY